MAQKYVALIGDIIRSRRLPSKDRHDLQLKMSWALERVNEYYLDSIASKFLVTIGDEFQGLLRDAIILPRLIRTLEAGIPGVGLRLGVGYGPLHTELEQYAIGMDGPAWYAARGALIEAKSGNRLGGVFIGFGEAEDRILNGFARPLHHLRARLTPKQRILLIALLESETQSEVALRERISKQAVSKQARALGWEAYREGEEAWKLALSRAVNGTHVA